MARRLGVVVAVLFAVGCVGKIPPPRPVDTFTSDDDDATAADDDDFGDDDDTTGTDDDDDVTGDDDDDTGPDDDDFSDDDDAGDDDDTWEPPEPGECPCDFGQLCLGETCVWAPTLAVGGLEASSASGPYAASANGCFFTASWIGDPVVAIDGPCIASVLDPADLPDQFFTADSGDVSVLGGNLDPIEFLQAGPSECLFDQVDASDDLFSGGQVLQVVSEGGADVPSFESWLVAPNDITGVPGAWVPGNPMSMAWSGGGGDWVELVLTAEDPVGQSVAVTCRVPDTGGYVVPATMTSWLPTSPIDPLAVFSRVAGDHIEFPDDLVVVEIGLQTRWTVEFN